MGQRASSEDTKSNLDIAASFPGPPNTPRTCATLLRASPDLPQTQNASFVELCNEQD